MSLLKQNSECDPCEQCCGDQQSYVTGIYIYMYVIISANNNIDNISIYVNAQTAFVSELSASLFHKV